MKWRTDGTEAPRTDAPVEAQGTEPALVRDGKNVDDNA